MTYDDLIEMTDEQLARIIAEGNICSSVGCYNQAKTGIVLCIECYHGKSEPADPLLRFAKRLLEKSKQANN